MAKRFSAVLERFLVFLISACFVMAVADMLKLHWISLPVTGISGLLFILIQQIFAKEKIKPYLHVVVIFFYTIFIIFVLWLIRQINLVLWLIPFLTVEYLIEYVLNNQFVYHDLFINECGNLDGEELKTHLFHNNLSAIDFGAKAKTASTLLTVLPPLIFIITFGALKAGFTLKPRTYIFITGFFIGLFFDFFVCGIYKNDVFFGFLGFKDYISDKKRLFKTVLIILCGAIVFASVLSSDKALLKIKINERTINVVNEQPYQISEYNQMEMYNPALDFAKAFPERKRIIPEWFWDLLFGIIKWAAITVLAVSVIIFLLKPFFSAHWKQFWNEGRLIKFFRSILDEIKALFKFVFKRSESSLYATVQSRQFGESIKEFLKKAGRSKEKNAEIDRLTKHFMKLINWGEAHKIPYKQTLAPAEYTALFNNQNADTAGMLFEKALYDKEVLSADEEKSFVEAVKAVISQNQENQE